MLKLGTLVHWEWFKQTQNVSYSTKIYTVLFYNLTSEDITHHLLTHLMSKSWVLLIIEKCFNQTHSVRYSMNIDIVMFYYFTSEKVDTKCKIIYCARFGYFWPLKSGLSGHIVLSITRWLIQFCFIIWLVKKSDTQC